MTRELTRRALLAGLTSLGGAAWAEAPLTSLRPQMRATNISRTRPQARRSIADMIADRGLTGQVGLVVADARTGDVLEAIDPATPRPPASVTKAVTALYALEVLGPDHRFDTRVLATAPMMDGRVDGDLILAGGGDPNLVTDDLFALASTLAETGLREVTGRFLVWDGAIRDVYEIDDSQLDHLGYNPSVSGLNLNYNRVHFEWKRSGGDYTVTMDARSETHRPAVTVARMRIVDRDVPVYTHAPGATTDQWTVARGALGNAGSRWLPVRHPALYAGEVFATFMRSHGLVLKPAVEIAALPDATLLARHQSPPLRGIMRDMLKFSTNLTAEVAGMVASATRADAQRGLRTSALGMTRWTTGRAGIVPTFVDHSGLGDASRISAGDMVRLLTADGVQQELYDILKPIAMRDDERNIIADHPARVMAKTGTLNFVSTLAGYLTTGGGRDLAFAFFAADLEARARGKAAGDETPAGSVGFNGRAKRLQQDVLQRWALMADR